MRMVMARDSENSLVAVKPKRPYKPKVRTGCTTCKIRRIKCDEKKPNCMRCTSTGRKCDGYDIPRALLFEICSSDNERRSFDYFRQRTAFEIQSYNEKSFWSRLVLQASQSREAVRHAVIAIGSLHESFENGDSLESSPTGRFALEQHTKALRALTKNPRILTIEEVLIACILFTWFENVQCNFASALVHLQNGLNILADWRSKNPSISGATSLHKSIVNEELTPILDRLHVAAGSLFPTLDDKDWVVYTSHLPQSFDDIHEAHFHFYQLIHWTCKTLEYDCIRQQQGHLPINIITKAVNQLSEWGELLADLEVRSPEHRCSSHNPNETCSLRLGILHLKIQLASILTMTKCLPYWTEMTFDNQTHHFEEIVDLAELFHTEAVLVDSYIDRPSCFRFAACVIPSLFLVASRCREPGIRRRAITLLRAISRREGIWDSDVAACLSERIMIYEEEGLIFPFSCQDVPDSRRLQLVNCAYFSYSETTKRLELSFDSWDPEWMKLECRRSGQSIVADGFEALWCNRRGNAPAISENFFSHDVPGLFPQLANSNTRLWEMLDAGRAMRFLGRFSSNHIFSSHSRGTSSHGDFITLSGELTQYLASEQVSNVSG